MQKKLVDQLIDECTKTIEEVKLTEKKLFLKMKMITNMVLVECILY